MNCLGLTLLVYYIVNYLLEADTVPEVHSDSKHAASSVPLHSVIHSLLIARNHTTQRVKLNAARPYHIQTIL